MRVTEKQNCAFGFKTSVGIVNPAFPRCQADFIKILPAVHTCGIAVAFNLKPIKTFQLQFIIER